MNIKNLICAVSVVALASAATVQAQSLPELARMEKERRAKLRATSGPAKVYTEADQTGKTVEPPPTADGATPATGAPAAAGAKKTKEKTPEELAADKQAEWAARLKQTQDEITSLQAVIAKNERNLNSTYTITPARADLAAQIEGDKKKVADLQQTLLNLEEERRRAGMPRTR